MSKPILSVVLPAYGCSDYIGQSVQALQTFFGQHRIDGEIVVVDDGSSDSTAAQVPRGDNLQLIRFAENRGKGAAIRAGMLKARGEVRVFTDADLPYGTEPLAVALGLLQRGPFHVVIGDRSLPDSRYSNDGWTRKIVSSLATLMISALLGRGFRDTQCGLKAFRGDVAERLFAMTRIDRSAVDVEILYLLLKYGLAVKRIPVVLHSQAPSTVRVLRDSWRAMIDLLRISLYWRRGAYRSDPLREIRRDGLLHTKE